MSSHKKALSDSPWGAVADPSKRSRPKSPASQLKEFCAWIEEYSLDQDRGAFLQLLYPFVLGVFAVQEDLISASETLKSIPTLRPIRGFIDQARNEAIQKKGQCQDILRTEEIPVAITNGVLKAMQTLFSIKLFPDLSYILTTVFKVTIVDSLSSELPKGVMNTGILEIESNKLMHESTSSKRQKLDPSSMQSSQNGLNTSNSTLIQQQNIINQQQQQSSSSSSSSSSTDLKVEPSSTDNEFKIKEEEAQPPSIFLKMTNFGTQLEETPSMKEDKENMVSLGTLVKNTDSIKGLPSVCFSTFYGCKNSLKSTTFSHDGGFLAGGFGDSSVRVWAMSSSHTIYGEKTAATLCGHSGPVYALDFSQDGNLLASASGDSTVRVWARKGNKFTLVSTLSGHIIGDPLWAVTFSPNSMLLASGSHDKTICIWTMCNNNTPAKSESPKSAESEGTLAGYKPEPDRVLIGHKSDVTALCFHPQVDLIASGSADRTVRVWNLGDGKCWKLLLGHEAEITCLKFSPNGRFLASGDAKGVILVWSLEKGKCVKKFGLHKSAVFSLDFSKEGSLLVSGANDNTIRIWNGHDKYLDGEDDGRNGLLHMYLTKETPVFQVMFTRRNLLLASGHSQNIE